MTTRRDVSTPPAPGPLVWPIIARLKPDIRSFAGHTNTVPDIVGRIGPPPSLVIFTEGNHFMALLSDEIMGAFPPWAKSQTRYADLDLDNVIVVTLPQPIVVQMVQTGGIALGNLTLEVNRAFGFYPDIVMGGPDPLRQLCAAGVIERQARLFSKSRGFALLVRRGNPLGIRCLADVARVDARLCQADSVETGARNRNRAVVEALIGKNAADAFFSAEIEHFPGRLGIMHRDVPEMLVRSYADVGFVQYHLASYYTRTFPDDFELVPIAEAERFPVNIGFARAIEPLRPYAVEAFEQFFFDRARNTYPQYDFAPMDDDGYGAALALN